MNGFARLGLMRTPCARLQLGGRGHTVWIGLRPFARLQLGGRGHTVWIGLRPFARLQPLRLETTCLQYGAPLLRGKTSETSEVGGLSIFQS